MDVCGLIESSFVPRLSFPLHSGRDKMLPSENQIGQIFICKENVNMFSVWRTDSCTEYSAYTLIAKSVEPCYNGGMPAPARVLASTRGVESL